ncbi:MAG: hypothetical protein E7654_07725 [Ruminococcaceae bacterium]|nr:hypothetical protein [Oscillospiraceae bacterium]
MMQRVCFLLTALVLICLLCACGGADTPTDLPVSDPEPPVAEPLTLVADGQSAYRIVRAEEGTQFILDAASALHQQIAALTGAKLEILIDWESDMVASTMATEYEIVLGSTSRNGKYFHYDTSALGTYDYDITVIENRVLIVGGSDAATARAVEYFIENYLPETSADRIEIDPALHMEYRAPQREMMKIMSLNLLATDTEYGSNANISQHLIALRQPRVQTIILNHMPDSIGLQECSSPWRQYFDSLDASWNYDRVGAEKHPKVSILYNTDRLELTDSGSIWLTEDPEHLKVSVEWEGNSERLAHYAIFMVKGTDVHYIHVNTHVGTESVNLQTNQAKVVRDYCEKLVAETGYPVVCTGDFNFTVKSPAYTELTGTILGDAKMLAAESSTGTGSFNKMGKAGYPKPDPIDQVMVSTADWNVYTYAVDYTTFDGSYYSDHYAVVATMTMRK